MPIVIRGLKKAFEGKTVLDGLSLTLPDTGVVAVMGPSGAGKTTLVNILMGLTAPDAGQITGLAGKRFTAVFQEDRLLEGWSAVRNIRLVCPRGTPDQLIREHLGALGLGRDSDALSPVRTLSGGMRRRVALARAMLPEGDIVVLDEPFKGLDDQARGNAARYILQNARGRLVLLITHDPDEAAALGAAHTVTIGAASAV